MLSQEMLQVTKSTKLALIFVYLFGVSACSSTVELEKPDLTADELGNPVQEQAQQNKQNTEEVKAKISVDDNDSVAEKNIENEDAENNAVTLERQPAINLYTQQQATKSISVSDDVRKTYQQALLLMKKKQWQQAQVQLDKVITQQPLLSGSYVNKAIIMKNQGDLIRAQVLLNKAISVNQLNLYAHYLQGQVYRLQGEFDKAEQSYLTAIAIWPDFAEAYASMAVLLELYRGRLVEAYKYYAAYLVLKPNDEEVKRWQAGLAIKIKRARLEIPTIKLASFQQSLVDKSKSVNQVEEDNSAKAVEAQNEE